MEDLFSLLILLFILNALQRVSTTPSKLPEAASSQCIGKHEMPLSNLLDYDIVGEIKEPILTTNFDVVPDETILENTDRTITLTMKYNTSVPTVTFEPSSGLGTYRLEFLYFYWDYKSSKTFPFELHAVFYNTKAKHFYKAMQRKNSIVVFAFELQIAASDESQFDVLQKSLQNVRTGLTKVSIENRPLIDWMANNMGDFILYQGTLPYFNCLPQVIWVDFVEGIEVKPDLLNEFKSLRTYEGAALMEQYKPFIAPTGPLVIHFFESSNMKGIFGGIPLVDAYSYDDYDDDYIAWASSGTFQKLKQLKQVVIVVVFFEIYLMFY